jgi:hypothetical protein
VELAKIEAKVRIETDANAKFRRGENKTIITDYITKVAKENYETTRKDPIAKVEEINKNAPNVLNSQKVTVQRTTTNTLETVENSILGGIKEDEEDGNLRIVYFPEFPETEE